MHNLAGEQRTQILLFASGIYDNSLSLFSAKAEGPSNLVYALTVEDVRRVPGSDLALTNKGSLARSVDPPAILG